MKTSRNPFKVIFSVLFGLGFILFIVLSLASLFKFLYFPTRTTAVKEPLPVNRYTRTILDPVKARKHFHILDPENPVNPETAPMCLRCHGNFCHVESETLRSFYNMHSFYIACETCHIRKEPGDTFAWFDDETGAFLYGVNGDKGVYGAKIVGVRNDARLDSFPQEALALEFMENEKTYSEQKRKKVLEKLMGHISKEAVTCAECHSQDSYLDFAALGYDASRIQRLMHLEILQLIDEYKDFYLPTMFNPGSAGGE